MDQKWCGKDFALTVSLYFVSAFILTIYGINVCPFLESLPPWKLTTIILVAFLIVLLFRTLLMHMMGLIGAKIDPAHLEERIGDPWKHLVIDLSSWVAAGALVTAWNSSMYDFPLGSGVKVILGCFTLGVFSSLYLSLRVENQIMTTLANAGSLLAFRAKKILPLSAKFLIFITLCFILIALIIILLVIKDLDYLAHLMKTNESMAYGVVIKEICFAFAVLLLGTFAVAYQFGKNLKQVIAFQLQAFDAIEKGNYKISVPVVTRDEFSLIADGTNQMIIGLQEKEKIKTAFGKYMSPAVAQSILESEKGSSLGGRLAQVVILFIDIRNYTSLSEKRTPQEIVSLLNAYFTLVVQCVHTHQGVVDKFIGDAAMAVFGLDEKSQPEEAALKAAFQILEALPSLNQRLEANGLPAIGVGIGIHGGPAVAGNIGSDERLEYTVIGDTVNIASRLESLNKELHSQLAVSQAVYDHASAQLQQRLQLRGSYPLKGKSQPLSVYSYGSIG